MTIAGIAVLGRLFLKFRLTFFDDLKMRQLMRETVQELVHLAQMAEAGRTRSEPIYDIDLIHTPTSAHFFNRRFDLPMSGFITYNPAQSSTEAVDGAV